MDLDYLLDMLQANWYYFAACVAVCIGVAVYTVMNKKKARATGNTFLTEHPNAAKIYLTLKTMDSYEPVKVHSVGGNAPAMFFEGPKSGFYLMPGKSDAEISYKYIVGSVAYKHATRSTGKVKKELVVEANKSYLLSFDRQAEKFTFSLLENE